MKDKPGIRTRRIADLIAREIATILRTKAANLRFVMATVTGAKISKDLQIAHVYVSVYGDRNEIRLVMDELTRASGYFRSEIGRTLKLKFTPEIRFVYDQTVEKAHEIIRKIESMQDSADAGSSHNP